MNKNKYILSILTVCLLLSSNLVFSQSCPEGTWNRNQSTAIGGGLSNAIGGGRSTAIGGGLSTGTTPYCTNRLPLHILINMGIIDYNYNLL